MIRSTVLRRLARNSCVLAAIVCVVMLGIEVGSGVTGRSLGSSTVLALAPGTAPNGSVVLTPASGPLDGVLSLSPNPAPAFCPGDSVVGYRWQTFISAAANDPATFVYDSNGPTVPGGGTGPSFPLVSSTGITQVARNTAANTGNGGQITPIPGFNLSVYGALLPDGNYSIGFACSLANETVRFWTARITVAAGSYSTSTPTTTTTTTAATTTSTAATTTTTTPAATTTTVVRATTTSVAGGTTTTTTVAAGSAATVTPAAPSAGGSYSVSFGSCQVGETITFSQPQSTPVTATATCAAPAAPSATGSASASLTAPTAPGSYTVTMTGTVSAQRTATFAVAAAATPVGGSSTGGVTSGGSPTFGSTGTIPATGSSTTSLIVWGVLLLVFGRMAILLGRKPKVRPVGS